MAEERRTSTRRRAAEQFRYFQQSFLDKTFEWFEKNILATEQAHTDSTIRRRIIVLAVITFFGSITLLIFGGIAFVQKAWILGWVDLFFAAAFLVNLYSARTRKNYQLNILVGIILAMLLYGLIYLNGGVNQTAYVWYYTFPFMSSYLLGSKKGIVTMLIMTIPVATLMVFNLPQPFFADYDLQFEIRFLCSYLLVGIFSYFFEKADENNRHEILAINKSLEDRVQSRTAELTLLNKQLLQEVKQHKNARVKLEESEERFRTLHNASFGGIAIHDQGMILDCNQGLSELTGYTRDELIGMNGLNLIGPQWRDTVREHIKSESTLAYEVEAACKDGTIIPISIHEARIPHKGRTVWVTEFRDITEQKKSAEEKLKLEEQLFQAQKMETIGQLAGGIAHDFNNMLGVIIGHSEMAMMKSDSTSPLFNDLVKIRKAADRSAEITRQLLAFARKQTVEPKILDLNETVEGMLQMIRRLIGEDIKLIWLPGDGLWKVKMDASQIDQILVNLCVNARDAIAGVGELIVRLENYTEGENSTMHSGSSQLGEYVRLSVSDTGCGMDEKTLNHAFEPFFTTKGVGVGTGLGLATVYGAVKQNNGMINVSSIPGQGTTIEICIPRYQGLEEERAEEKLSKANVNGSETILVVEDEQTILDLVREMLEHLGYNVLSTVSPVEAVQITETFSRNIHLFLLDVIMPEINGRDLAERLLTIKPKARCLYMSGYTSDIIASQGLLDEGIDLIQKPFSQQELAVKIRQSLDLSGESPLVC